MAKRDRTTPSPSLTSTSFPEPDTSARRRLRAEPSSEANPSATTPRVTYSLSDSSSSRSLSAEGEILRPSASEVISQSSVSSESEVEPLNLFSPTSAEESPFSHTSFGASFRMSDVEAQLDRLQVDRELKESILAMDREMQIEMINDIVRSRNMERMENMLQMLGRDVAGGEGNDDATGNAEQADSSDDDAQEADPQRIGMGQLLQALLNPGHLRGSGSGASPQLQQRIALFEQLRHQIFGMMQSSHEQEEALRRMGINRDIDEMSYEELLDLEEKIGSVSKGLPQEKLDSVMVRVPSVTASHGQCMICLDQLMCETLETGVMNVCRLKVCDHSFHETCIKGWLKENKICPICKKEACA